MRVRSNKPGAPRRDPLALRAGDRIEFTRDGKTFSARVLPGVDSDPTAAVWAVDLNDPDVGYIVEPREVTAASRGRS